jgi:hypothetical protein
MARRRAARLSKQLPPSPAIGSSTTSYMRRPFSLLSTASSSDSKRTSVMGLMDGVMARPEQEVSQRVVSLIV